MSTYENTPLKKPVVKNAVDPVVSGVPPLVQRDFAPSNVQPQAPVAVPQQVQPVNIFAGGGQGVMGKFESQLDVMPKESMFEGVQQTVRPMNNRNQQPDAVPRKYAPQQGSVPVAPIEEPWYTAPQAPKKSVEPDSIPQQAGADEIGLASWNPVDRNPERRRPDYSDYDKMPQREPQENRKPDYMDWSKADEEYRNCRGWNDMYEPKEQPKVPYKYPDEGDSFDLLMKAGKEDMLDDLLKNLNDFEYKNDKKKRDGGFFGWLRNNFGNPDRKDGESDDEYRDRILNNRRKILVLADSLRQLGNVVNASRGGLSQKFNDPLAAFETQRAKDKAEAMAKDKMKADNAYRAANLQIKQDAANADRAYKEANLDYNSKRLALAQQKQDDDNKNKGLDMAFKEWKAKNDLALGKMKLGEQSRHNRNTEAARWASVGISQARENRMALKDANGGGSSGSFVNIATSTGSLRRKKDLNPVERRQIYQKMKQLGLITANYDKKITNAWDISSKNDAINFAIGYAAMDKGKKNDEFRKYLIQHFGYTAVTTEGGASKPVSSGNGGKEKGYGNIKI